MRAVSSTGYRVASTEYRVKGEFFVASLQVWDDKSFNRVER